MNYKIKHFFLPSSDMEYEGEKWSNFTCVLFVYLQMNAWSGFLEAQ